MNTTALPTTSTVIRPNVMIGTPAYAGMVHMDYVSSLLEFKQNGILFSLMSIGNESLITRARNTILSAFHVRPEFTHLLFLDGDVKMSSEGLKKMLTAHRDVIGAPVALKGRNPDGSRIWNIGPCCGEEDDLYITDRVGTAALLLSRNATNALVADASANARVYARSRTSRGDFDAALHYDAFQVGVVDGEYLSEDYWACRRLRNLGFKIYVDATVVTQHHGTVAV